MRFKRIFVRASAFLLALLLMVGTPVGNYFHVREVTTAYASGAAMTAFQWIWAAILAACGVTTTDPVSIDSIADGVSRWVDSLTDEVAKAKYKLLLVSMEKASWGFELNAAYEIVNMVKLYLKTKDGYGTDTGIDNITISATLPYADFSKLAYGASSSGNDANSGFMFFRIGNKYYVCILGSYCSYPFIFIPIVGNYQFFITGRQLKDNVYSGNQIWRYTFSNYETAKNFLITGNVSLSSTDSSISSVGVDSVNVGFSDYEIFLSTSDVRVYYTNSIIFQANTTFDGTIDNSESIPVESKPVVQSRPIQQAGALRVPATMEEAYAQYVDFTAATTPDEVVTALNPSWDITYGGDAAAGEDDKTYPWVPDITGALDAIKDIITGIASPLTGIEKLIMEIPKILTDIYNGVISIPDTIAGFFSIDYAQVESAASSLKAAFMGKFEPLTAIVNVFQNSSASLNNEIPVMTMRVPDRLAPVVGGNEIIVFDLRGFEEYVTLFRNLIRCSIWLTFGYTVLGLFRIRFGID